MAMPAMPEDRLTPAGDAGATGSQLVPGLSLLTWSTDCRESVRFEEVSLGYLNHWDHRRGLQGCLRRIRLQPAPTKLPPSDFTAPHSMI
jgi:hypothetical protein